MKLSERSYLKCMHGYDGKDTEYAFVKSWENRFEHKITTSIF